jgi:DNA-binding IclR family transcriptional regulator
MSDFELLTNHGHVMLCVARDRDMRLRDIADCVGITERAAQRIVRDLESEGYLTRKRVGRRNVYEVHPEVPLRHDLEDNVPVGKLLAAFVQDRKKRGAVVAA